MKTEFFIAKRIIKGNNTKSRLSKPIIIISLTSIILGVAIMIITVSVITGFQEGIREKVIGFGSHIQITKDGLNKSMESAPILIEQDFYPSLETKKEVRKIQVFGYKPAILQNSRTTVALDSLQESKKTDDILGVLFKGVDSLYDWDFFKDKLIEGELLSFKEENNQVLISQYIARKMGYKVGDNCDAFFIRDSGSPKKQKFTVCGIYKSGFEDFDKKLIFIQLNHIQKLNNWGVQTYITLADTCINKNFVLKAITTGGTNDYKYDWGNGFVNSPFYEINQKGNKTYRLISSDLTLDLLGKRDAIASIPDTAYAFVTIDLPCECNEETLSQSPFIYNSATSIKAPFGHVTITNGVGTYSLYAGGFEIILNKWEHLEKINEIVYHEIPYDLKTTKITEMHRDIFAWLDLLDMNILIIVILILVVSLINMITSLLVLILEKTNMIGILKSIGAKNKSIRTIFIFHALFLLTRGLFWGNLLGIGLIAFQYFTGFFTLNAEIYSLDSVPVNFNLLHILYINVLTVIICLIILIIPSYLVTKINPIKAIRFD